MGYYLNEKGMPNAKKAQYLIDKYNAQAIDINDFDFYSLGQEETLVCVVENDEWDAAGLCFDKDEFERFVAPDVLNKGNSVDPDTGTHFFDLNPTHQRPRTWLVMPRAKAYELSGYRP